MSNEELVQLYQEGNKSVLDELVENNKKIVYKLASKFYVKGTNSIDITDLQQEGFIGLMVAAKKYNFNNPKKANFITYSIYWIYQKMQRFINTKNTNDEISLNTPVSEEDNSELMDCIEEIDYSFENVEEKLYLQQLRQELELVMNDKLSLKEREIIKLHFGWDKNNIMTLNEIGEVFNTSGERIRQFQNKAFLKMRNTPWGRKKAMEIYNCNKVSRRYTYSRVNDNLSFVEKYLEV